MSQVILGSRRADATLYTYVPSTNEWVVSAVQPPGGGGPGIWGVPTGELWVTGESVGKLYHYDGDSVWTAFSLPVGNINPVVCIVGSDDGAHVYAGSSNNVSTGGLASKKSGSAFVDMGVPGLGIAGSLSCDSTGQHLWIGSGSSIGAPTDLHQSSDYGASWVNRYNEARTVCINDGVSPTSTIGVGGVLLVSPAEVYVEIGRYGSWGRLLKWNGVGFEIVARTDDSLGGMVGVSGPHVDLPTLLTMGKSGSGAVVFRDVSGSLQPVLEGSTYVGWPYLWPPLGSPSMLAHQGRIVVAFQGRASYGFGRSFYSADEGATWALISDPWGPDGIGRVTTVDALTLFGPAGPDGPYVTDESPAPDTTHLQPDEPVTLAIRDDQGNLDLDSVRIYVNGTLAWHGGRRLGGFIGVDIEAVTDAPGYLFELTPAEPFEPGVQTIRVVAEDTGGNPLDTTYTFATVVPVEDSDEPERDDELVGLDLLLDTSHDLVVQDYDLQLVAGADEVAQHLLVGLRLFRAEWYLDEDAGVPYWRYVLTQAPNTRVIEGIFRQQIVGDPDVEELTEFDLDYDRATRKLAADFRCVSRLGPVDVSAVFP